MPAKITPEQHIDRYISTAPRDALIRLQSEVSAALKYRVFPEQAMTTGTNITLSVPKVGKSVPDVQYDLPGVGKGAGE
jgi:hypothetical protein